LTEVEQNDNVMTSSMNYSQTCLSGHLSIVSPFRSGQFRFLWTVFTIN